MNEFKIIECPRDAMQGIDEFISTDKKIKYQNALLKCGFDTLDFGSFVSPKAIPQMRDTAELLKGLDLSNTNTKLLSIIANLRGAETALSFEEIDYLGYPFSVSETFQLRNTNATIEESWSRVAKIAELTAQKNKEMVVYLSMGFGNIYGDPWNEEIVFNWAHRLHTELGVNILAVSDTVGAATPQTIHNLLKAIIPELPNVEIGAHLHVAYDKAIPVIEAAISSGCTRLDCAIKGYGGCPMAEDELVGNMPAEILIDWLNKNNIENNIDVDAFYKVLQLSSEIFPI